MSRPLTDDEVAVRLDRAAALTECMAAFDGAKATASHERRHLWLRLQRAGVTYPQLAARCGVSEKTVNAALALARSETNGA